LMGLLMKYLNHKIIKYNINFKLEKY
jgi:hypothetical protein